ncbi:MAG TPA: signal peptide peptidase SppA [Acetobacteraceae bacterium]|nr:signal peptide peptidase SppA [Acetobacteraceae bacterium]
MSLDADLLIDRQRLKRRLAFWRVLAVVAVVLALILVARPSGRFGGGALGQHIERFRITGLIGDGQKTIEQLNKLANDNAVAAVLLHLDTPGGQVSGGEGIHQAVAALAAKKPVVAVLDGTAASAGYMIAVAAPHIVSRASTITGSIGVILETANFGGLLDKIGVSTDPLVSGPLKGQPSFDKPMTPEARAVLQAMIGDLFDQFVQLVAEGRHMDPAKVRQLADGRAYTGRQALPLGLVDELGGEPEALHWLETVRHVPADLKVTEPDRRPWMARLTADSVSNIVTSAEQTLRVDGAWSVWQPFASRD